MNDILKSPIKIDLTPTQLPVGIDEVILQLEKIIEYCNVNNYCAGYFAVLYHKVTCSVRECINNKNFEDCERMQRLDVAFANRYLEAFYLWVEGKPVTDSWKIAFDVCADKSPLVIQHLLLGMNAHINLDLGIATALVMKGFAMEDIHKDFDAINVILASMIDNIEECLTKVNPLMKLLNLNIYNYDEMLVRFSIDTAREGAWKFAQELSNKTGTEYNQCINTRDQAIQELGIRIARPHGVLLKFVVKIIRLFEKKSVPAVIKLLGT